MLMTNLKYLFYFFISIILLISCTRFHLTGKNSTQPTTNTISLKIGNKYYFRSYAIANQLLSETYITKSITGEKLINGNTYFEFSDGAAVRSEKNKILILLEDKDLITLDFTAKVGDTIHYKNYTLIVDEIIEKKLLDSPTPEKIITASNRKLKTETRVRLSYATRFGITAFSTDDRKTKKGLSLMGAELENVQYGRKGQ